MTDTERMLLSDAIETAIEAERDKNMWRRLAILFFFALILLSVIIIGG